MDKKLGQGSAFPSWDMTFEENPNKHLFSAGTEHGMSKRFYAACCAMQGLISYYGIAYEESHAQKAFYFADELLKQENE